MHNPDDRLHALLARLVEETLLPEEQEELERRLASDPDARKRYVHYLDLHAELQASFTLRDAGPFAPDASGPTVSPRLATSRISPWRLGIGAAACVALGMLFASVAWAYATPRLRASPPPAIPLFAEGFETSRGNLDSGLPMRAGVWSGDDAQTVGPEQGFRPKSGTSMLRFTRATYSGENAPVSRWGDVYRLVEWPGALGSEQGRIRLSASFAALPAGDEEQYAMSVSLMALDSLPSAAAGTTSLPMLQKASHTHASRILPIKRDGSWQQNSVETFVSPQTRYVLIHLAMVRRFPQDSPEPLQFRGHYLDDVKLEFLPQSDPSPSSR
ncbi:MAG: hypothetical protein RLZZ244_603 [Verrucomicrobiota bacterium]|jgi:hypothetical protein